MALSKAQESTLKDMATKLRIHSVEMTSAAKSGHPTSCASMAETMAVLFYHTMRYRNVTFNWDTVKYRQVP